MYPNGEWPESRARLQVIDPRTRETIADMPGASNAAREHAARAAFDSLPWKQTTAPHFRRTESCNAWRVSLREPIRVTAQTLSSSYPSPIKAWEPARARAAGYRCVWTPAEQAPVLGWCS